MKIIRYITPVSYTHLDVYKRQALCCSVFVGCSSQNAEANNQQPAISQGKVDQESVAIVQGENYLVLSNDEVYRLMNQKLIDNTTSRRYTMGIGKNFYPA